MLKACGILFLCDCPFTVAKARIELQNKFLLRYTKKHGRYVLWSISLNSDSVRYGAVREFEK